MGWLADSPRHILDQRDQDDNEQVTFIDVAIPKDSRIKEKKLEKSMKGKHWDIKVQCPWGKEVTTIPAVIRELGASSSSTSGQC